MTTGGDQDQALTNPRKMLRDRAAFGVGQHPWSTWSGHVGHPPYRGDRRDDHGEAENEIDRALAASSYLGRRRRPRRDPNAEVLLKLFFVVGGSLVGRVLYATPIAWTIEPVRGGGRVVVARAHVATTRIATLEDLMEPSRDAGRR